MLSSYIKEITRTYIQGDAREESFYSILEKLLYSFAEKSGKNNLYNYMKYNQVIYDNLLN